MHWYNWHPGYAFACGILIILFLWYAQSIPILPEESLQLETSTFVLVCID